MPSESNRGVNAMFITHGPVPPESHLFVGRTAELKRMENWLTDVNWVGAVMGARQTGKTSLLLKLRHILQGKYAFAYVDLQAIEGAQTQECFNYIAGQIVEQLRYNIGDNSLMLPSDNMAFSTFLREMSRTTDFVRIVVILDEMGALPPETAIKLASTIRAMFTARFVKPELARYIFLLAGATDMLELTTGRNSPLRNVTETIYLGDLSLAETEKMLAEVFDRTQPRSCKEINRQLHVWASGHPYWTQLLAAELATQEREPSEEVVRSIVEELLRGEDRNLPYLIRSLRADNGLWILVESLLDGVPISFSRANAAIAKLELIGVLKNQDGRCAIRNQIYREALHRHQIKPVRLLADNLRLVNQLVLSASDPLSLLNHVAVFLQQVLQCRAVSIFRKGRSEWSFQVAAAVGVFATLGEGVEFPPDSRELIMLASGVPIFVEDSSEAEKYQLRKMAVTLVVPLRLKDRLLGFVGLGSKLSGEEYDSQDQEFLATVAQQVVDGIERISFEEWKQDAERALEIQRGLLPREIPQILGYEISGAWQPARTVSGDYYDVLRFDERRIALCIGDVVGKGMPAALLMSNLQAHVRVLASAAMKPEALCEQVNRFTLNNISPGRFITFFYAMVDAEARQLTYANAGHNAPILLRRNQSVLRLDKGGTVLGMFPDWKYQQGEVDLVSGDRLMLFTDGVSEAQDLEGQEFGEDRLIRLLIASHEIGAVELQQKVMKTVTEFCGGNFHDDATLIAVAVQ